MKFYSHKELTEDYHEGYEVEFFAGNGETIAVVSVPATALRAATPSNGSKLDANPHGGFDAD